jgi:thiosulfate/3-mercaptopyruvate sulfurtransferase
MKRLLIPATDLKTSVDSRNLTVLDARPRESYDQDHIPGSVHLHPGRMEETVTLRSGATVPHMLVSPDRAGTVLRAAGVSARDTIVVYDEGAEYSAARLWWVLTYLGHPNTLVLDGGLAAWRSAGGAVDREAVAPSPGDFVPEPDDSLIADFHDVLLGIGRQDVSLVNTLDEESFEAGAIPGSVNLPYQSTFDAATKRLLSETALFDRFDELDVEGTLILYCGIGYTASQGVLASRVAGFRRVKLYDGSLKDWSARGGALTPRGLEIDSE